MKRDINADEGCPSFTRFSPAPETPGAFLGRLRVMAVDGTVLDVPDSKANARVYGYPGSRRGYNEPRHLDLALICINVSLLKSRLG